MYRWPLGPNCIVNQIRFVDCNINPPSPPWNGGNLWILILLSGLINLGLSLRRFGTLWLERAESKTPPNGSLCGWTFGRKEIWWERVTYHWPRVANSGASFSGEEAISGRGTKKNFRPPPRLTSSHTWGCRQATWGIRWDRDKCRWGIALAFAQVDSFSIPRCCWIVHYRWDPCVFKSITLRFKLSNPQAILSILGSLILARAEFWSFQHLFLGREFIIFLDHLLI